MRELARYLEAQEDRERERKHHVQFSPFLVSPPRKKYHVELSRYQDPETLQALVDTVKLIENLRNETLEALNYQRKIGVHGDSRRRERVRAIAEAEVEAKAALDAERARAQYDSYSPPYSPPYSDPHHQRPNVISLSRANQNYQYFPSKFPYFDRYNDPPARDEEKIPVEDEEIEKEQQEFFQHSQRQEPEFTFHFDEPNLNEKRPFGVKPNDLRYYHDFGFFSGDGGESEVTEANKKGREPVSDIKWENVKISKDWGNNEEERNAGKNDNGDQEDNDDDSKVEENIDDSMEKMAHSYRPLVVPVNNDSNTDIYFIAIVAGCSAAAMFVLVLISLTWCRLQRGVKAAADIEYPAYGVTGPNKDVSPSGDQRLAQSAQMYHFQHQKQQIIAMENRVSTGRDPGSVSEAESDEENEEGDYTVYECPGLASTGEMEVKNPLFHDDPTPATPVQPTKQEDHI